MRTTAVFKDLERKFSIALEQIECASDQDLVEGRLWQAFLFFNNSVADDLRAIYINRVRTYFIGSPKVVFRLMSTPNFKKLWLQFWSCLSDADKAFFLKAARLHQWFFLEEWIASA